MESIVHAVNFIDHVYETLNVYHTLILTNKKFHSSQLETLLFELKSKDFPVTTLTKQNVSNIDDLEAQYRIFILNISDMHEYMTAKNMDIASITIMLCMDCELYAELCEYIKTQHMNIADNLYIFSCDNV